MNGLGYSEEERDALAEVVNIAMGQAGANLARTLDVFVELSVPNIRLVERREVVPTLRALVGPARVAAVRQAFFSQLRGEALILFGLPAARELGLLGGGDASMSSDEETLLDIANLLCGACLCGIAGQLSYDLSFCPPAILARETAIEDVLEWSALPWRHTLIMDVGFKVSGLSFQCHVLVFWPDDAISKLGDAVGRLLAQIEAA